ncbi:MAG: hypothetical protein MI861_06710 [Pirellulales bacterium]|nr:hypothetical protein [Pirellulales bacterium]
MDGTTEPLLAVIGHPIAGNPSQFALERALKAMDLDWRVVSFDVPPDKVSKALEGADVLGIRGVLIDATVTGAATDWYRQRVSNAARIDCLFRDEEGGFAGHNEQQDWLAGTIEQFGQMLGREIGCRVWLGDRDQALISVEGFSEDKHQVPPDPDEISEADLIVISDVDGEPAVLDVDDWPACEDRCLVIDLTDDHPQCKAIEALGYQLVTGQQRRIGVLAQALRRWTGCDPALEVIHDAIEEYLAV